MELRCSLHPKCHKTTQPLSQTRMRLIKSKIFSQRSNIKVLINNDSTEPCTHLKTRLGDISWNRSCPCISKRWWMSLISRTSRRCKSNRNCSDNSNCSNRSYWMCPKECTAFWTRERLRRLIRLITMKLNRLSQIGKLWRSLAYRWGQEKLI